MSITSEMKKYEIALEVKGQGHISPPSKYF